MSTAAKPQLEMTILIACVGRRVELVQAFRAAALKLDVRLRIVGTDHSPTAPALACVDLPYLVPPISDAGYIQSLREIVRSQRVAALIPTIDTDLHVLSEHRDDFAADGCTALIADASVIGICRDKIETYRFLCQQQVDTPATYLPAAALALPKLQYPYIIKPRYGSASQEVHRIDTRADLDYFLSRGSDPIVQEFVAGDEHTLDVYVGLSGEPRCVVPRKRLQTRAGEVSKGVVVKDRAIMDAGLRVVKQLGTSPRGLVTLQCIVTADRRIRFIEINPRFGGGAPLGIAAGADYASWLIQELLGMKPAIQMDGFVEGVCMSRYDWSVFTSLGPTLEQRLTRPLNRFPSFQ